ncbi:MAG: phasin family protein [Geminicoccaceae bacterium]
MARATTSSTPEVKAAEPSKPEVRLPEVKLPSIDLGTLHGLQTANLAAWHEAQHVLLEAVQAIGRIQYGLCEEAVAGVKTLLAGKAPKEPHAILADVKAAAEKAVAAGKQGMDLSVAAQRRVAELVAKRVQANIDEFKSLAA